MQMYQDIYSRGAVSEVGYRDCSNRYNAIRDFVFAKYKRTFTILDVGANCGYFSIRAATEYDATAIMIQKGYGDETSIGDGKEHSDTIVKLCKENPDLKLSLLDIRISSRQLKELSQSENFDVVLALSVLHHFGDSWKEAAEAMLSLGHLIVVETPHPDDKGSCGKKYLKEILEFFKSKDHALIGHFSREHTDSTLKGPMLVVKGNPPKIEEPFIGTARLWGDNWKSLGNHSKKEILSTFENRELKKSNHNAKGVPYWVLPWINGMNLLNFLRLGGRYPSVDTILEKFKNKDLSTFYLWDDTHKDICIHNFILNGSDLHLIDIEGNNGDSSDESGMNQCITFLENRGWLKLK